MYDKVILSDKVAEDIRTMINENDLKPGDKLPNEIELTSLINVSRSTIREAIKILVSTNVLEVKRGKGTFVTANPGVSKDPLGVHFMEEDNYLAHFFEMRLIIEPKMVELAVLRASDEEIKVIEESYNKVEAALKSGINHTLPDIEFHNAIAKASKNPIMERIIPIINNGIEGGYTKTKDNPEVSEIVLEQHAEIMKYINERNSKEAKLAMERHILYGYNRVKNL